jgi:hypothetical protein
LSVFPPIYLIKADALSYSGLSAKTTDNRQLKTDNSAAGAPATDNRQLKTENSAAYPLNIEHNHKIRKHTPENNPFRPQNKPNMPETSGFWNGFRMETTYMRYAQKACNKNFVAKVKEKFMVTKNYCAPLRAVMAMGVLAALFASYAKLFCHPRNLDICR